MLQTNEEYLSQIKEVGKYHLKDTYKWRERALYFKKYGQYTDFVEGTADWIKFWEEEEFKILNGVWIDGFYIPGTFYFYLNYLQIYHKQRSCYDFPDLYDMDYHTFLCLEHAKFLKKHFVVIKKRQAGFSLKFLVPIMIELWFQRGSPCYYATYEQAQVEKGWSEILEPYREFLNASTPWYREFYPDKMLNWRVAKELTTASGKKLTKGRKNTLRGLILSKSPSKGVGGGAKVIFADEAGVNPVLMKFLKYVNSQTKLGAAVTGQQIVSGAVGELKHLETGGLKKLILSPEAYGFYYVINTWDKEMLGKKCGFFVPESWAYYTDDGRFIDADGNSDVEGATEYILENRKKLKEQSISDYLFEISQAPLSLSECFQYRSENIFPTEIINPQIFHLEERKEYGTYVELYRDRNGDIKHRLLDKYTNSPVLIHPINSGTAKEGVIQIFANEFPKPGAEYGMYWAGVDIVRDAASLTSPSLNCIHIYKGYHKIGDEYASSMIVAKYMGRPDDKMEWFERAMLLMEWYNANALVENNVGWFIEEAIKAKKQFRLAKTPQWYMDYFPQSKSILTKPYGIYMNDKIWLMIEDALVKYVSEVIDVTFNDVTGEPTKHYGVERIRDIQLLREMLNYRPREEQMSSDNYDSLVSFGLALLHAQRNEMIGVIQSDEDEEDMRRTDNFSQKSRRLQMMGGGMSQHSSSLRSKLNNSNFKRLR